MGVTYLDYNTPAPSSWKPYYHAAFLSVTTVALAALRFRYENQFAYAGAAALLAHVTLFSCATFYTEISPEKLKTWMVNACLVAAAFTITLSGSSLAAIYRFMLEDTNTTPDLDIETVLSLFWRLGLDHLILGAGVFLTQELYKEADRLSQTDPWPGLAVLKENEMKIASIWDLLRCNMVLFCPQAIQKSEALAGGMMSMKAHTFLNSYLEKSLTTEVEPPPLIQGWTVMLKTHLYIISLIARLFYERFCLWTQPFNAFTGLVLGSVSCLPIFQRAIRSFQEIFVGSSPPLPQGPALNEQGRLSDSRTFDEAFLFGLQLMLLTIYVPQGVFASHFFAARGLFS